MTSSSPFGTGRTRWLSGGVRTEAWFEDSFVCPDMMDGWIPVLATGMLVDFRVCVGGGGACVHVYTYICVCM